MSRFALIIALLNIEIGLTIILISLNFFSFRFVSSYLLNIPCFCFPLLLFLLSLFFSFSLLPPAEPTPQQARARSLRNTNARKEVRT